MGLQILKFKNIASISTKSGDGYRLVPCLEEVGAGKRMGCRGHTPGD